MRRRRNAYRFAMDQGHSFLGGRSLANKIRNAALDALSTDPDARVVLDFAGIRGVSHSFADELIAPMSEKLGRKMGHRVTFEHCDPFVVEALRLVCEMHSLNAPHYRKTTKSRPAVRSGEVERELVLLS